MQSVIAAGGYPVAFPPAAPSLVKVTVQVDPDTTTVVTTPPSLVVPQ